MNEVSIQKGHEESLFMDASTVNQSMQEHSKIDIKKALHKRNKSSYVGSKIARIPTENIKFDRFIDILFKAKVEQEETKAEIKSYVQALETNYNEAIKALKIKIEKQQKQIL